MASNDDKHAAAKAAEAYGDYVAYIVGIVSVASLFGAIAITLFPDHGTNGLFDLSQTLYSVGGVDLIASAIIASGMGVYAYGTNQLKDAVLDLKNSWKQTEAVIAFFTTGFPLAYSAVPYLQDAAAGNPEMQAIYVGSWGLAMAYIVRN